ncbi:MAG: site-specific DNA-methyltransferase [Lysinibacillus sp.]
MPNDFVNTVVTSPPYWGLRDYGVDGQIGLENSVEEYVSALVDVFREIKRVLKDDGTLWLNLGDTYAGSGKGAWSEKNKQKHVYVPDPKGNELKLNNVPIGLKPKDLMGLPWRVAFALQADGWYLRSDIIWEKPNCMPESATDRPTKAHEYIFLLSKSSKYYFDGEAIKEPAVSGDLAVGGSKGTFGSSQSRTRAKGNARTFRGGGKYTSGKSFDNSSLVGRSSSGNVQNESGLRNKRSVWTIATAPMKEAHFATFPEKLIEPCILAGATAGGIVLDPFFGSGTTGIVAIKYNRNFIGIELNPVYIEIAKKRLNNIQLELIHELGC